MDLESIFEINFSLPTKGSRTGAKGFLPLREEKRLEKT
jgi:hypothetical protein